MGQPIPFYGIICREDNRKVEVAIGGVPPELKHLSKVWKINQLRDSVSSGERKRISLNPDLSGCCRASNMGCNTDRRTLWNKRPERVKASYFKSLLPLGSS
jgi:hypothetical protein